MRCRHRLVAIVFGEFVPGPPPYSEPPAQFQEGSNTMTRKPFFINPVTLSASIVRGLTARISPPPDLTGVGISFGTSSIERETA